MLIDCISDLHGNCPKLDGGDLLIIAGDLTARDEFIQYYQFCDWLDVQEYRQKIVIAGNHDSNIFASAINSLKNTCFLHDSGYDFEDFRIWGSPWTLSFDGMNPLCKAFVLDTEEELSEKWKKIPSDTNILITHTPPHEILDSITPKRMRVGSSSLRSELEIRLKPSLHVFGHIHEGYGEKKIKDTHYVNAAIMNRYYEPINKPIRVVL